MTARTLVTGATGLLGQALMRALRSGGVDPIGLSRSGANETLPVSLSNPAEIVAALDRHKPTRVFHLAGVTRPNACETDRPYAWAVNVDATQTIADWCRRHGAWLLLSSSDWVFDGEDGPYAEDRSANPATFYGQTKLAAERHCDGVGSVARLGLLLNDVGHPRLDFLQGAVDSMRRGQPVNAVIDEWRSPLAASAASTAILGLAAVGHRGMVHVGGAQSGTPMEFIRDAASRADVDPDLARPISRNLLRPDNRPRDVRLDSRHLAALLAPSAPSRTSRIGIVIPVYNGGETLADTLAAIADQAGPGVAVAVVVNGSADNSAAVAHAGLVDIARAGAETHLITLPAPSRPKALDAGDAILCKGHRLYVDQDAIIGPGALKAVVNALNDGAAFVGARAVWRGGTAPVRAAMTAWSDLPYVRQSPVCAGMFGVSEAGRATWAAWPEGMPDDKFARLSFPPADRRGLDNASYSVCAPTNFRDLVATRRRYRRWTDALAKTYPELAQNDLDRGSKNLAGLPLRRWLGACILLAANRWP